MAPAIGVAILSAVGVTATATSTAALVVGTIVLTGASIGLNLALANANRKKNPDPQVTLNDSVAIRRRIYGRMMVGGARFFAEQRDNRFYQAIALASGEIDAVEQFWIGDKLAATASGTVTTAPWNDRAEFQAYLGTDSQTASGLLTGAFPVEWTSNHRARGVAYVAALFVGVKEKQRATVWPQASYTQLRFVVRGAKVWDPRHVEQDPDDPATWTWSNNPALCILDYMRHADGMGKPRAKFDIPAFVEHAYTCDETVTRKDSSTESRYTLNGEYNFDEGHSDVLERMFATSNARIFTNPTDGKIGIRGGKWYSPGFTLPSSSIVAATMTEGNDKLDTYNRLKVIFRDPDSQYKATPIDDIENAASIALIGPQPQQLDLAMVTSWTQAARLGRIKLRTDNPDLKGEMTTHLNVLAAMGEPTVQVQFSPISAGAPAMIDEPCQFTGIEIADDLSCSVSYQSHPSSIYDYNAATDEPPKPASAAGIADSSTIAAPTSVISTVVRSNISGEIAAAVIRLDFDASTRDDTDVQAEYAVSGGGEWLGMTVASDEISALTAVLEDGGTYDLRVRFTIGGGEYVSAWVDVTGVVAVVNETPPTAPVSLSLAKAGTTVTVSWINANDAMVYRSAVYRGTTNVFGSATLIATLNGGANFSFAHPDGGRTVGTTYYYWVRALNGSGIGDASSTAGPSSITV